MHAFNAPETRSFFVIARVSTPSIPGMPACAGNLGSKGCSPVARDRADFADDKALNLRSIRLNVVRADPVIADRTAVIVTI